MGDSPKYPTPAERIRQQFRETTLAGRIFLLVFYPVAFGGIGWFVFHFKPKTAPYFHALGSWLRATLGDMGGNLALFALVAIPLAALYFGVERQRD